MHYIHSVILFGILSHTVNDLSHFPTLLMGGGGGAPLNSPKAPLNFCSEPKDVLVSKRNT